jgi:hypothetical protein
LRKFNAAAVANDCCAADPVANFIACPAVRAFNLHVRILIIFSVFVSSASVMQRMDDIGL